MAAEHDTTHWCQNGRPTRGLAGDAPRTVTSETLVTCWEHVDTRHESGELQRSRPDCRTQVIYEADNEQDEARGGGQHRRFSSQHSQERFQGMTISDELLQMIEKVAEKPNKVRIITTARLQRFTSSLTR